MNTIEKLINNVEKVIVGKRATIERAVIAMMCRGHILLEDVPGTGKTMLARALSRSINVEMKRLQCTPDLLPSDITGVPIYNQKSLDFEFRPGPVFTHLLLADEINRATPRAQSSLLECMEEFRVTVDGTTYDLPPIFMVIATQNPIDMAGTHALPEAQLDRFFMRLSMGYPQSSEESAIVMAQLIEQPIAQLSPVVSEEEILVERAKVKQVHINPEVMGYATEMVNRTRKHPDLRLGVSPRGTLALVRAAQGYAHIRGMDFVSPDMVKHIAPDILEHRLILRPQATAMGKNAKLIIKEIIDSVKPPQ